MKWKALATSVALGLSVPTLGLSCAGFSRGLASPKLSSISLLPNESTRQILPAPSSSESEVLQTNKIAKVALAEKSNTVPTKFWWLHGVSVSQVKERINAGYRIIDLEVEKTSPLRFSVAMIKNQGVYAKSWWWYYGLTSKQIKQKLSTHKARIIDLQVYRVNDQKRYAVVLVPNTGSEAKSWWYYTDFSLDDIMAKAKAHQARIVDLDTYVVGGKRLFSAVMIKNKGGDQKAWWVYSNKSADFITSKLKQHKARLIDIERRSSNNFTVVMERSQGQGWWWYYGVNEAQVNNFWEKNKARIFDIEPYTVKGKKRFAVLMLQN